MAIAKRKAVKTEVDTKSLFAKLNKKSTIIKRAGGTKAPAGFVEDAEVVETLQLRLGKGVTCKAQIRSVQMSAWEDTPILKIRFVVVDGPGKGLPLSDDIWLPLDDDEKLEKALQNLSFMLQKLGYETDDLDASMLEQLCTELTAEKPYCVIYVSCYKRKGGKKIGQLAYGIRVNSPFDPNKETSNASIKEDDTEDSEDEDEGDTEEEYTDEDEEDSDIGSSEESAEEVTFDEDDPSTWVGYVAKCRIPGSKTVGEYPIASYDADEGTLSIKAKGKLYSISPEDVIDFAE